MKSFVFKALLISAIFSSASTAFAQTRYQYQSPEVWSAWGQGYQGQGTVIAIHDDFATSNLGGSSHGALVAFISQTTAPQANIVGHQGDGQAIIGITANKLNIFNLSYGYFTPRGSGTYVASTEAILRYAQRGQAVVVKSAGNSSIPVGHVVPPGGQGGEGNVDGMAVRLAGQQSAIIAGALSTNGTTSRPASMAWYSNTAGTSPVVQSNFLVVGVDTSTGILPGTSYAAPIISGYAAILGSKFTGASPTAIVNQLLNTARTDTVVGYNPAIYGRGEASISRALAPSSIR